MRGHAVIYYFDVDEFKSVNDTFGQGVGDAVLAEVGSTIYAVFSKVGYCYRIGGDEFCVIAQISDMEAESYLSEFFTRWKRGANKTSICRTYPWAMRATIPSAAVWRT